MTPDVVESKTDDGNNTHPDYLLVSPPPVTIISDHHHPRNDDNVEPRWNEHRIIPVDVHHIASKEEKKEDEEKKDEGAITMMMNKTTSKQASPYRWSIPTLPHPDVVVQVSRSPFSKYGIQNRVTTSETRTTTTTSSTTTSSCSDSSSSNFGTSGNRSTSPRSSSSSSSSNASLPKVTLESQNWTKPAPRRLMIPVEHIGHLRKVEREKIVQWYHQQQQHMSSVPDTVSPPSKTFNSDSMKYQNGTTGSRLSGVTTASFSLLVRDSTRTSSMPSNVNSSLAPTVPTFLMVTGPTGSGKTKLLQSALHDLMAVTSQQHIHHHQNTTSLGYYICGAFDVLQHPDPYRAYTQAMTDFTNQFLARGNESTDIVAMRHAIMDSCGDEIHVLIQMIPSLSAIVNENEAIGSNSVKDTAAVPSSQQSRPQVQQVDATQRFIFVMQKFLRAICSVVQSIVLVLDDIQYADECSIDVLCSILTDLHETPGLCVATTYNGTDWRNDTTVVEHHGMKHSDPAFNMATTNTCSYFVEQIRKMEHADGSIDVQNISIENFDEEQVQYLLTQTLQQSSLFDLQVDENFCALVMEQTSGNLYHIIEFLYWLEDHQLLATNGPPNASNKYSYWTWNIDDIYRAVYDHIQRTTVDPMSKVQQFLFSSNKFDNLPFNVIEMLKVGACFGNSRINASMIQHVLDYPIPNVIAEMVQMGILVHLNDREENRQYAFAHENVQQSVYHLIAENQRDRFHLEIGRRLLRGLDKDELDRNIFVVLSQIRIGRRLITRLSERYKIAALCLHAGRKAAKTSSFRISLVYLKLGIEVLGDRPWRDEYDLTLMLYNATAEMEVCSANYEGMELLVLEILKHSRRSDDTIQARTTQVYALCVSDRQHEGLKRGIQLVADLGYAFPSHFSLWTLRSELKGVLALLKGKSNDYLKRLPLIDDANVLAAMHVLNMLYLHAVLVRPRLAAFVSLKMMKLTLTCGLSFIAPLAFSTFGMLCAKIFPTPDAAFRYGEIGLELLDKFQVREYLPRIYAAYYACIFPWKHHLPESLDYLIHAERVGMQVGDVEFACLCANLWGYIATDSDIPLNEVETHWLTFQNTMKSRRQKSSLQMSVSCLQAVQYLQGKDVDLTETEELLKYSIENKIVLKTANIRWWEAKTALIFNDLFQADELAYVANFSKNKHTIPPTSEIVQTAFLNGMIALVMASQPRRRDNAYRPRRTRKQYIAEGKRMIRLVKKYVLWAPINYHDKQVLLEAELAAVLGQKDQAMQQYNCAIALSKVSRNILVQGLSNERAGRYCFSVLNQPTVAMKYFDEALLVYGKWKAYRKVDHLQAEIATMFRTV